MSNLFQFIGGGSQLGDFQVFPVSTVTSVTKPNGEVWLRTGYMTGISNADPAIANVSYAVGVGEATTRTFPANLVTGAYNASTIADNGSGTLIMTYANATNIMRSTDGGVSWSLVAHGMGVAAVCVVYHGGNFILVGNSTTTISCSYSTTGASWTTGGTAAVTSATAGTARIYSNGTHCMIVVNSSSTSQAASTTNGITLTARTTSQAISGADGVMVRWSGSSWVVGSCNSTSLWTKCSTSDGASGWTNTTGPSSTNGAMEFVGSTLVVAQYNSTNYYTSADLGATWSATQTLPSGHSFGQQLGISYSASGTAYFSGAGAYFISFGVSLVPRVYQIAADMGTANVPYVTASGNGVVISNGYTGADNRFIAFSSLTSTLAGVGVASSDYFVRIK